MIVVGFWARQAMPLRVLGLFFVWGGEMIFLFRLWGGCIWDL